MKEAQAAGRITSIFNSFAKALSRPASKVGTLTIIIIIIITNTSTIINITNTIIIITIKVAVLGVTLVILGLGLWGTILLQMEFRPEWLMDPQSEIFHWYRWDRKQQSLFVGKYQINSMD